MYWRMASHTSSARTSSHRAASAPRKTVLGMARPSTSAEMPSASIAVTRGSSQVRALFTSTRPPGLSSSSQPGAKSVSSR